MSRRRTPAATTHTVTAPPSAAAEPKPLVNPADLEAAWAELRQTAGEANVTSFRACSRPGRYWGDDPDAVRAIAATIRRITNSTAQGPKSNPSQ
ncbi:hypothetical protein WBO02_20800 [Paenarthrobacter sp. CCNWYY172]